MVRRSLSRDDTGLWTDYIEWVDLSSAQAAASAAHNLETLQRFLTAIDGDSMSLRYATMNPLP